jgi:hypothetical protein
MTGSTVIPQFTSAAKNNVGLEVSIGDITNTPKHQASILN